MGLFAQGPICSLSTAVGESFLHRKELSRVSASGDESSQKAARGSKSLSGGNQVDGLPPAPVDSLMSAPVMVRSTVGAKHSPAFSYCSGPFGQNLAI